MHGLCETARGLPRPRCETPHTTKKGGPKVPFPDLFWKRRQPRLATGLAGHAKRIHHRLERRLAAFFVSG